MSRRRLSDEEAALWQGVTRSISPLRRLLKRRAAPEAAEPEPADAEPMDEAEPPADAAVTTADDPATNPAADPAETEE